MHKWILLLSLSGILLSACGANTPVQPTQDINAIYTSVAQTVVAEFTLTAGAVSPTSEGTATETPTLTPGPNLPTLTPTEAVDASGATLTPIPCDDSNFDLATVDVTVLDGTEMTPGQDFVKTWNIKNTGSCTWGTGYTVIYGYGDQMDGIAEPLTTAVAPGEEVEVSVRFKAPSKAGSFHSYWRMANVTNSPFGKFFSVNIVVR